MQILLGILPPFLVGVRAYNYWAYNYIYWGGHWCVMQLFFDLYDYDFVFSYRWAIIIIVVLVLHQFMYLGIIEFDLALYFHMVYSSHWEYVGIIHINK